MLSNELTNKDNNTSTCHHCGKNVPENLQIHLQRHENYRKEGKTYKCVDCHQTFEDKICWTEHRLKEHPSTKNRFHCNTCGETFQTKYLLTQHFDSIHANKRTVECEFCNEKFFSTDQVKKHLKTHEKNSNEEAMRCFYCEEMLQDLFDLKIHIQAEHSDHVEKFTETNFCKYKCGECKYSCKLAEMENHYKMKHLAKSAFDTFKCRYCPVECHDAHQRSKHSLSHFDSDGNINFKCQECPQVSETAEEYATHYYKHYAERPLVCRFCTRRFKNAYLCTKHEGAKHSEEMSDNKTGKIDGLSNSERRVIELNGWQDLLAPGPERNEDGKLAYICCEKKFYGNRNLLQHMRIHREKVLKCETCKFVTNDSSTLKNHVFTAHTDERPLVCNICGRTFKEAWSLKNHSKVHANKKPSTCNDCGLELQDEFTLMMHKNEKHGGKYKCTFCDLKFLSKIIRIQHEQNAHPEELKEECNICGAKFKLGNSLSRHLRTHEPSFQKCSVCQQEFSDEYSFLQHANTVHNGRIYKCDTCGNFYKHAQELKRHRQTVHNEYLPANQAILSDGLSTKERMDLEAFGYLNMLTPKIERNQNNELAFLCRHCKKKVYRKNLRKHLLSHGEGTFNCEICKFSAYTTTALQKHMRIHNETSGKLKKMSTAKCDSDLEESGESIRESDTEFNLEIQDEQSETGDDMEKNTSDSHSIQEDSNVALELTSLPMAAALSKELLNNYKSYCFIWTTRIEPDLLALGASYPTRCYLCLVEEKQISKEINSRKLKKTQVFVKRNDDVRIKVTMYSFPSLKLNKHEFDSVANLGKCVTSLSKMEEVVHFLRETNSQMKLLEQAKSRIVVCNCIGDLNRITSP